MDFSYLLEIAKQNEEQAKEAVQVKRYSTQVSASKKSLKPDVKSDAIKNFLQKKELEEKQKDRDAKKKKEELLALRSQDRKANARVQAMLKRTKSASKAVVNVGSESNTSSSTPARTTYTKQNDSSSGGGVLGDEECDYVSQESSEFFKSFVQKYGSDISTGKQLRVFKQIHKDAEPRKNSAKSRTNDYDSPDDSRKESKQKKSKSRKEDMTSSGSKSSPSKDKQTFKKPKSKAPPPEASLSFHEILKLAAQKQTAPAATEVKSSANKEVIREAEFERPMTQKEKEEYLRQKEHQLRREGKLPPLPPKPSEKITTAPVPDKKSAKTKLPDIPKQTKPDKKVPEPRVSSTTKSEPLTSKAVKAPGKAPGPASVTKDTMSKLPARAEEPKQKPLPPKRSEDLRGPAKGKALAPPRQFPPYRDIRPPQKRRLESDDEDYDSELDDFIDDGPEEGAEDYSKYIKEIFGYDKARFRRIESDDEDECMESSFTQQMKEEKISTRIGIMEDLEDIRREEEEKKQKMMKKKKRL